MSDNGGQKSGPGPVGNLKIHRIYSEDRARITRYCEKKTDVVRQESGKKEMDVPFWEFFSI